MKLLKDILKISAIVIVGAIVLGAFAGNSGDSNTKTDSQEPIIQLEPQESEESEDSAVVASEGQSDEQTNAGESLYGIEDVNVDGRQMTLGDKGLDKSGAIVCLPYVKRASAVPTAVGPMDDKVGAGNEVILGYFEFFNDTEDNLKVRPDDITCYADSVQVSSSNTNFKIESDGVKHFGKAELMSGTKVISVQEFVVPMEWTELKFFASDNCVWTVTQDDVTTAEYNLPSVFPTMTQEMTPVGSIVYSGDYDLAFDGMKYYTKDAVFGHEQYLICKFQIKNTSESSLNVELVGFNMQAYTDGFFNDDYDYSLEDNVDGYINIFDVNEVAPGMMANIYVAFDILSRPENALVQYNDGYLLSGNVCYAYAHVD